MMLRIKLYIFYCQESMICVSQGFESQRSSQSQRVRVSTQVTSHELRKSDLSQSSHKSVCVCVKNTVDLGSSMKTFNVWVTSANSLQTDWIHTLPCMSFITDHHCQQCAPWFNPLHSTKWLQWQVVVSRVIGHLYSALLWDESIARDAQIWPVIAKGSHSFTCHSLTNHTCLYSPAAGHHCPFGWYSLHLHMQGWPSWVDWVTGYIRR